MVRRLLRLGCWCAVLSAAASFGLPPGRAAALTAAADTAADGTVPAFGHVFVIVGENKSLSQINSSNAPYITNTLQPASAWLTNYNDVARGSLADYVGLTSGQYASCETSGPCGQQNVPSIFSQLGDGGWQDWNESMPSNCYETDAGSLSALNAYQAGHNPAPWFAGLPCSTYDVPAGTTGPDDMTYFNNALAAGTVPASR
jgi:acid phosphatase